MAWADPAVGSRTDIVGTGPRKTCPIIGLHWRVAHSAESRYRRQNVLSTIARAMRPPPSFALVQSVAERLSRNVERVIVGKRAIVQLATLAMLCEGHLLIEDVP